MFDFGIGSSELVIVAVVALIVIGPKDLPRVLRTIGQFTSKMRSMAREFQRHLDEATREAGLDDVKSEVNKMTNFTVTDMDKAGDDIKKAIEETSPKPASNGNGADAGAADVAVKPAKSTAGGAKSKTPASRPVVAAKKRAGSKKTVAAKAGKAAG
jgi:sec-independent protein translocase protein TatB